MSDVADFISEIETMYRREYKEEEVSFIRDRLFKKEYTQKVLIRAVEDIERIDSNYLPSPKEVLAITEKAHYDMTPKKPIERETGGSTSDVQFRMFKKLRELMFNGTGTRQQIYDMIRLADKERPGSGWDICGMTLEADAKKHAYDLSKPPDNYIGAS